MILHLVMMMTTLMVMVMSMTMTVTMTSTTDLGLCIWSRPLTFAGEAEGGGAILYFGKL